MKIEKGYSRIVFVFDKFKSVIKIIFPINALIEGFKIFGLFNLFFFEWVLWHSLANSIEYFFYILSSRKIRSRLAPTYFSFCGLINITKKIHQIPYNSKLNNLFESSVDYLIKTSRAPKRLFNRHELLNQANYGFYKNKLVLLDYGSFWMAELFHKFPNEMELFFQELEKEILKKGE